MSEREQTGELQHIDGPIGWAIWVGERRNKTCIAVVAESQEEAEQKALEQSDEDEIYHVDGPFEDAEPAIWEFEYVTEHRERVVVEAPFEGYAEETAESEREHRGDYIQTVHTERRKVSKEDDEDKPEIVTDGGVEQPGLPHGQKANAVEIWNTALDRLPDEDWADELRERDIHERSDRMEIEERIYVRGIPDGYGSELADAFHELQQAFGWSE